MGRKRTKEDLRIVKTKEKLSSTLMELLKTQSIDDVSISTLCEQSGISRATFYNNFSTVYDVFDCYLNNIKKQLETNYHNELFTTSLSIRATFELMIRTCVDYIDSNREQLRSTLNNNSNSKFNNILAKFFTETIKEILATRGVEMSIVGIDVNYLAPFISGGIACLINDAIISKDDVNKDALTNSIIKIIGNLFKINSGESFGA